MEHMMKPKVQNNQPDYGALLAEKRSELLTPVHTILDTAERMLVDVGTEIDPDFSGDVGNIVKLSNELTTMFVDILRPDNLTTLNLPEEPRRKLRHDILNKFNGILMASDLWIEEITDDDKQLLAGFLPDFQLIDSAARRCVQLIDNLLGSWNAGDADALESMANDGLDSPSSIRDWIPELSHADDEKIVGRILIVDDDDISRHALERHLAVQGHDVLTAEDGRQGWEMLQSTDGLDIVLLDIMMPGISGFELLQRMKTSPALQRLPVIMISALGETDAVVKCIKAGADDFLPKPFNRVLLNARINACLKRGQLEKNILLEKKRADDLLGAILPREIVTELKNSNEVQPRRHEQIAVLFADIVNFTSFCEKHTPHEVLKYLQELVVSWEKTAECYQVEKIKTIGDAFMAAAGFSENALEPVEACVRCGLEMIRATQELDIGWNLRVGVHAGPVVAGVLGKSKFAFDLWGDTVNTASRMESHGVAGSVVLTADAFAAMNGVMPAESLGYVTVKGKGAVEAFRIDCPE